MSKNVQNYKKTPIYQNLQTLKNPNSNPTISSKFQTYRDATFRQEDKLYFKRMYYFCDDEFIVQFIIDKTGQVGEVKVVRPISEELDAEAVRVVKALPKFEPGRQDGEAVSVWYTLPISFKLQSKPKPQPQDGE